MIVCSSCGRENPENSLYCNKCGRRLDVIPQEPPRERKCPSCGRANPEFVRFCQYCAKELLPPSVPGVSQPEKYCAWCGAGLMLKDIVCPRCGHDPTGMPEPTHVPATPSQKPAMAGVTMIGAGVLDMASSISLFVAAGSFTDLPIDISGILQLCGGLVMFFGIVSLIGSYFAYRRRHFALSIIAAALGMIGLGPFYLAFVLGLVSVVLLALSRDSFID